MSRTVLAILCALFIFGAKITSSQANVSSANYGNERTNSDTNETLLTRAAVASRGFGKVGSLPVDGQVYAQPLYVAGLHIPGHGIKNVVFAATMNNSVYAFDADAPESTVPLWRKNLGPPAATSALPWVVDLSPQLGILSTPAISASAQVIFVVAETYENGAPIFRLHALSLLDGHEMQNGPVAVTASVGGTAPDGSDGVVSFDPVWQLQRPGLTLANGNVYVAFGAHGDAGNYHGWVMAYNAANLKQQVGVFNSTPNGIGGGIWQSGRALAVDRNGNLYAVTGNGDFDGQTNFSGAMLKLSGSDLSLLDWYTPKNWSYLSVNDLDVGSTGPVLVPGTNLILTGDKSGRLIHLHSNSLGHVETEPKDNGFMASGAGIFNLALWHTTAGTLLYQHDINGVLKAYPVTPDGIVQRAASAGTWRGDSVYHGMVVSSNGPDDGIVWEITGNHSREGTPAILHAWNASDLTKELFNSSRRREDRIGSFTKFGNPLVANGRVYVATLSGELAVYGIHYADGQSQVSWLEPRGHSTLLRQPFAAWLSRTP